MRPQQVFLMAWIIIGCGEESPTIPIQTTRSISSPEADASSEKSGQSQESEKTGKAEEAEPPPAHADALIRTQNQDPVPLYRLYEDGFQGPLPSVESPAEVREIIDVVSPRHHGSMLAYEVRLTDDRRGWVSPDHLLMAGVRIEGPEPVPLLHDKDPSAVVLTELTSGERLFYDPIDRNPYDSKDGCESDWVRVRSLDGHEGFLVCGWIQ
jgi:hypothetical protein